jgi:hypothetical protein
MKRRIGILILFIVVIGLNFQANNTAFADKPSTGLYPDMRTVIPLHLQLVNRHQKSILRFSNGIANTGDGPLRLRPLTENGITTAIQEILDKDGNIVLETPTTQYEFHEAHNHWHVGDVALFEIHSGSPTGPIVGTNSIKVTFCLLDWYKLIGNSPTSQRYYWDCYTSYQGISPGWVDQYHHSLEGQALDLTGVVQGRYYLVSTSNPSGLFLEKDMTNNTAWVSFDLTYDERGNAKITIVDHSPCDSPGLCGEGAPNR